VVSHAKIFFNFLLADRYEWVTKAKRNTSIFRKEIHPLAGRERYVPVKPAILIREVFPPLSRQEQAGLAGISVPHIYMKMPHMVTNRKGEQKKKYRFTAIAAVVAMRLKEDEEPEPAEPEDTDEDKPATYRGTYVLISKRADVRRCNLQDLIQSWWPNEIRMFWGETTFSHLIPNMHNSFQLNSYPY